MEGPVILVPIIITVGFFAMICYIVSVWLGGRNRHRLAQLRLELQQKMLDRFGSAEEFVAFAQTAEGRKLLESSAFERTVTHDRSLSWVRYGTLLAVIGLGFGLLTLVGSIDRDGGAITSVLFLFTGIGALSAAFLSRRFAREWAAEPVDAAAGRLGAA